MKVAIASDHRGFLLKDGIAKFLSGIPSYEVLDLGPDTDAPSDYPDYAHKLASLVADGAVDRGVLICGSGIGMAMAANRHKRVRAAVIHDESDARYSRAHNDSNVACLSANKLTLDSALKLLQIWLETPFEGGRHARRVDKIDIF
jgi:ribose 5-phosphate isomerase B